MRTFLDPIRLPPAKTKADEDAMAALLEAQGYKPDGPNNLLMLGEVEVTPFPLISTKLFEMKLDLG